MRVSFNQMVKSNDTRLNSIFHALSDPTRRAILHEVASGERTVGEVARPYAMSLAAVSKHLNVLETADLIKRERRGPHQIVHLQPLAMREAEHWLRYYESFWNDRLNVLQTQLEGEEE